MVLNDYLRGKLPHYLRPPGCENIPDSRDDLEFKPEEIVQGIEPLSDEQTETDSAEKVKEEDKEVSEQVKPDRHKKSIKNVKNANPERAKGKKPKLKREKFADKVGKKKQLNPRKFVERSKEKSKSKNMNRFK